MCLPIFCEIVDDTYCVVGFTFPVRLLLVVKVNERVNVFCVLGVCLQPGVCGL